MRESSRGSVLASRLPTKNDVGEGESDLKPFYDEINRLKVRLETAEAMLAPVEQVRSELDAEKAKLRAADKDNRNLRLEEEAVKETLSAVRSAELRWCSEAEHFNRRCFELENHCGSLAMQEGEAYGLCQQAEERERAMELSAVDRSIALAETRNAEIQAQTEAQSRLCDVEALESSLAASDDSNGELREYIRDLRTSSSVLYTELGRMQQEHRRMEEDSKYQNELLCREVERSARIFSRNESLEAELFSALRGAQAAEENVSTSAHTSLAIADAKEVTYPPVEHPTPIVQTTPIPRPPVGSGWSGTNDNIIDRDLAPTRRDYPRSAQMRGLRSGVLHRSSHAAKGSNLLSSSLPPLAMA